MPVGGKFVKFILEQSPNEFSISGQLIDKYLVFIKTDNTGDTMATKVFKINSPVFVGGGISFEISYSSLYHEYYVVYSDFTLAPINPSDLLIFDSTFNFKSKRAYHVNGSTTNNALSIEGISERNILIGGISYFSNSPYAHSTLFKTDSIGNLIWNRGYYSQSITRGINSITELNDSSFLISIKTDSLGAVIAKLDSTGNPLWCKSWFRPFGRIEKILLNSDGTITVAGRMDNFVFSPLFLMKIDTSGSVTWCKQYGDNNQFGSYLSIAMASTNDSGYIISGTFNNADNGNWLDILLMKLNQNGDTLWTRIHGSNTDDLSGEIIQTSDGGYFAAGHTMGRVDGSISTPFGGYYLIKTDSLGYSGCQEWSYPLPLTTIFPTDSSIILTVVQDSVIQDTANIVQAPLGYFKIYDGCLVTNVPEHHFGTHTLQIVPNPTKGIVSITTSEKPKPKDFITVYDSVGKIVLQRPYKQEKQEINLSHLSKGMYTIKIVQADKVSVSKVVVE